MDSIKQDFYKRVYKYTLDIVKFVSNLPKNSVCKIIGNQLLRSGTSVGANFFEAKSASSKKDYINYYQTSLKSANESKFWLCILRDSNLSDKTETERLLQETIEIAKILASSILTMKGRRKI